MRQILQDISLPLQEKLYSYYKLFYRGERGILDRERQVLMAQDKTVLDFATYLNGLTLSKWKKYTNVSKIVLKIRVKGTGKVVLVGYHAEVYSPARSEYGAVSFDTDEFTELEIEFPENKEEIIGFEIDAIKDVEFAGGSFYGEFDEQDVRNVELCIATTTCRKEEFIKSNIQLIKEEILEADDDMKNHFYVHVVDNGRTLDPESLKSWHIDVHPNKNTGGSGGFSRGMIESLEQEVKATHVLLMDDDVVVLPESLRRTYRLLKTLKKEYHKSLISGTMLFYEEMNVQCEDIGTLRTNCDYCPLKQRLYHENIKDNLLNEQYYYGADRRYAGWWYCCIPTPVIEEYGLSMPMFIRGDDIEYSLRCKADIITMNGICIWHMGFINKYNLSFDLYMRWRNLMMAQAIGSIGKEVEVFNRVCKSFRAELLKYNYNAAELILKAMKHYLEGPDFFKIEQGEKLLKENAKLNEKTVSLDNFDGIDWDLPGIWEDKPRKKLDTLWYRITFNGHRFWPEKWLKKDLECVLLGDAYQPQKYTRRRRVLAVNPDLKVGVIREIDKKRCKELQREWKKLMKKYKQHGAEIEAEYRKQREYLSSVEFWKKYLEI